MRIAIITTRARGKNDPLINNLTQVLSKKYDTHVYEAPSSPRLLWTLRHIIVGTRVSFKDYDLMITEAIYSVGAIISLWAKLLRKKSLILIFGKYYDEVRYWHTGIYGRVIRRLLSVPEYTTLHLADVILSPDWEVTEYLKAKRTKTVVYEKEFGVVDIQQFSYDSKVREKYRKKLNIPDSAPVLLFVGWLTKNDGADTALNAYRALSREIENLWLVFIGSGNLEEHIEKTIAMEKLERVKLVGFIPHDEIQNYMMVGDVALAPYPPSLPHCGIGSITLELMALGIPIIATDVTTLREVITNGETGFIVRDEVDEIAQKVTLLLRTPELINKMKRNARNRVEQDFSREAFSSRLFSLIDSCMNS